MCLRRIHLDLSASRVPVYSVLETQIRFGPITATASPVFTRRPFLVDLKKTRWRRKVVIPMSTEMFLGKKPVKYVFGSRHALSIWTLFFRLTILSSKFDVFFNSLPSVFFNKSSFYRRYTLR